MSNQKPKLSNQARDFEWGTIADPLQHGEETFSKIIAVADEELLKYVEEKGISRESVNQSEPRTIDQGLHTQKAHQ